MNAFPAFIPLDGARIVVVGDGEPAEAKARLVTGSVAEVVRAPAAAAADPSTYRGARLAFVAVDTDAAAEAAVAAAHAAGALVNVVDRPQLGDFHTPAIVDRSPVIAAIGTGGAAPVLATILRNQIETRWPEGLGRVAELSVELQASVREALPEAAARRAYWRRVLTGPAADAACAGDPARAREIAIASLAGTTAAGRVWFLAAPERAELLSVAAVRAFAAADRVVADSGVAPEILAYARRDAQHSAAATAEALAGWARAGHSTVVATTAPADELMRALAEAGVEVGQLPVAR